MHGNTDDTDDGRPSRDPARIEPPSAPLGGAGGPEEPGPAIPSETELSPEAPGARKLNLVGSSQLTRAVAEAVRRGLAKQFVFTEEQLETAVRSIGREMMRRLKANSKSVRGLPKDVRHVRTDVRRRAIEEVVLCSPHVPTDPDITVRRDPSDPFRWRVEARVLHARYQMAFEGQLLERVEEALAAGADDPDAPIG